MLALALTTVCFDCLQQNTIDKVDFLYCASTGTCLPASRVDECDNYEAHDLIFQADVCCSDLSTEEECLSDQTQSFCLFCPSLNQCMYEGL